MDALLEMAVHGDKTVGGSVKKVKKDGAVKIYRRKKEICPLCDKVTMYLTTHLQRQHQLKKNSSTYTLALQRARSYRGQTAEMLFEREQIVKRREKRKRDGGDGGKPPKTARRKTGLELLAEQLELSGGSSDDDDFSFGEDVGEGAGDGSRMVLRKKEEVAGEIAGEEDDGEGEVSGVGGDDKVKVSVAGGDKEGGGSVGGDVGGRSEGGDEEGGGSVAGDVEGGRSETDDEEGGVSEGGDDESVYSGDEEDEVIAVMKKKSGKTDSFESEDDEDDKDYEETEMITWKVYYKRGVAKNTREELLIKFCDDIQNILGGCKKEKQAILHAQHVRAVQDHLDKTVESLVRNGGMDVWKLWAKPLLDSKRMRPGSIKSYFISLSKYFRFIIDQVENDIEGFPNIPANVMKSIRSVKDRFLRMSSAVNVVYGHEKWQRQLEEEENAIPASVPGGMMETPAANEALKLLTIAYTKPPSEREFVAIRDYLIARLLLENCQRPGPLEEAKLADFNRAKEVDGKFVMKVARHKTMKAGPAPVTFTPNTRTNVQAYIKCVRVHFAKDDVDHLFVTKEGVAFPTGTIGKRVIAWWKAAMGIHLSSTDLRKIGSSEMVDEDTQTQAAVQTVMTHERGTAEKYYAILKKTRQAVKGSKAITNKLGLADSKPTVFTSPVKAPKSPERKEVDSPSKTGLSREQNAKITMKDVKNGMSDCLNFVTSVDDSEMVGKVYRRIKYLQKLNFEINLTAVHEDDEEDTQERTSIWASSISGNASGITRRIKWNEQDIKTIQAAFSHIDKRPTKPEIEDMFEADGALRDVMQRNTFNRCYEKVKTIFKQRPK